MLVACRPPRGCRSPRGGPIGPIVECSSVRGTLFGTEHARDAASGRGGRTGPRECATIGSRQLPPSRGAYRRRRPGSILPGVGVSQAPGGVVAPARAASRRRHRANTHEFVRVTSVRAQGGESPRGGGRSMRGGSTLRTMRGTCGCCREGGPARAVDRGAGRSASVLPVMAAECRDPGGGSCPRGCPDSVGRRLGASRAGGRISGQAGRRLACGRPSLRGRRPLPPMRDGGCRARAPLCSPRYGANVAG